VLFVLMVASSFSQLKTVAAVLTFGETKNISNTNGMSSSPKTAVSDSGEIFVGWGDDDASPSDVFFTNSTDGGSAFSSPTNLSNDASFSFPPKIAISGNNIYFVWAADDGEIHFRTGRINGDGTADFNTSINLSNNNGKSANPE